MGEPADLFVVATSVILRMIIDSLLLEHFGCSSILVPRASENKFKLRARMCFNSLAKFIAHYLIRTFQTIARELELAQALIVTLSRLNQVKLELVCNLNSSCFLHWC